MPRCPHVLSERNSELAIDRVGLSVARRLGAASEIENFERLALEGARFFGGAFNAGDLKFSDALEVMSQLPPTGNLTQEYLRAVTADERMDRHIPSTIRFATVTGVGTMVGVGVAGLPGVLGGVALSA
jgi:hypothetical protein